MATVAIASCVSAALLLQRATQHRGRHVGIKTTKMADEDPVTQVEGEPAPASPLTEYSVVYTDRALNL